MDKANPCVICIAVEKSKKDLEKETHGWARLCIIELEIEPFRNHVCYRKSQWYE